MEAYHRNIEDPAAAAALFAPDGALEMPYLASVGQAWRTVGLEAIQTAIAGIRQLAPDFRFINIHFLMEIPDQVFAEYEVDCLFNGKPYKQLYMGRMVAESGKIKLLREALNMYPVIKAFEQ